MGRAYLETPAPAIALRRPRRLRPRPSPAAKRCRAARAVLEHLGPGLRLQRERVGERHAEALDRGAAVGEHRALGEAREPLGQRERALEVRAGGDHLGEQAHRERLAGVDDAPGEDQVERAAEADDARQPLRAAVDQRHAPAPLGVAEP